MKKGEQLSEEQKAKMAEGRKKHREEKIAQGLPVRSHKKKFHHGEKPELIINGKEKNAFDFFEPIRIAFRKHHLYTEYSSIIKEISDPRIYMNISYIKRVLEKYVEIVVKPRYNFKWPESKE